VTQQLPLLTGPVVAAPLAIPESTRRRGLAGVATARRLLDDAARRRAEHEAAESAARLVTAEQAAAAHVLRRLTERTAA